MLGRAKSCRWQVFVRRRPPKQGELRTDVSKATMFQGERFASLNTSCEGERIVTFCVVQKVTKKHAGLRPATSIQSSAGSNFAKVSGGSCRNRFCLQNAGEKALNRCERVTVLLTQDRCFSKKSCCTASSQQQALFKKGCCTLVLV